MGCVVNGLGESTPTNISINLPSTGEESSWPIYMEGQNFALHGNYEELPAATRKLVEDNVHTKYAPRAGAVICTSIL